MAIIVKPHTFTAGQAAVASEVNADFDTIYSAFNGQIDTANISTKYHTVNYHFPMRGVLPIADFDIIFKSDPGAEIIPLEFCCVASIAGAGSCDFDLFDITGGLPGTQLNTTTVTAAAALLDCTSGFTGNIAAARTLAIRVQPSALFAGASLTCWLTAKKLITT